MKRPVSVYWKIIRSLQYIQLPSSASFAKQFEECQDDIRTRSCYVTRLEISILKSRIFSYNNTRRPGAALVGLAPPTKLQTLLLGNENFVLLLGNENSDAVHTKC